MEQVLSQPNTTDAVDRRMEGGPRNGSQDGRPVRPRSFYHPPDLLVQAPLGFLAPDLHSCLQAALT